MSLLLKFAPQIAAALALIAFGTYLGHQFSKPAYNRLQSQYEAFQLQTAREKQADAQAAQKALQDQIDARIKQESTNAQALQTLQAQADHAVADRDFAVRLLAAARKAGSGSGQMPTAADQPAASAGAETSGDRPATDLAAITAAAGGECRDAISQLRALQAELGPQLR